MTSSAIRAMRYDPEVQDLFVALRGGKGIHVYHRVPIEVWIAFRDAPSKSTFLNGPFRKSKFQYGHYAAGFVSAPAQAEATTELALLEWGDPQALPARTQRRVATA